MREGEIAAEVESELRCVLHTQRLRYSNSPGTARMSKKQLQFRTFSIDMLVGAACEIVYPAFESIIKLIIPSFHCLLITDVAHPADP